MFSITNFSCYITDGKIVLELSDRRENGKTWWVPVTQKTYWPPPPPSCSTPGSTVRQESSASFSVSDESSVQSQSSPWPRETRWKNQNPTKKRTPCDVEEFMFYIKDRERCRYQWSQRRRPFHCTDQCHMGRNPKCGQCIAQWRKKSTTRSSVAAITSQLLEKALSKKMMATATPVERIESLVSPRKRLLRDMEKVRLNDRSSNSSSVLKKAKAIMPATPLPTHSAAVMAAAAAAAAAAAVAAHSLQVLQPSKVYDRQSSYSIDSLLNKERQEEAAAVASCSSSFLRSLLRKAPPPAPSPVVNGVRNKSLVSHHPRTSDLAVSLPIGSSRPLQPPIWLPYPAATFPPPHPLVTASSMTLTARPGPSSRRETLGPRVSVPPDCNDDDDDVPLNLTIRRAREHS